MSDTILDVINLKIFSSIRPKPLFKKGDNLIPAVDDVSFYLKEKEIMGLVGRERLR